MQYKASAPGSLMLLGEYAVLYGKSALLAAIDRRITVTLKPRKDNQVNIYYDLGHYTTEFSQLAIQQPFQFVLGVLKQYQSHLKNGCDIEIEAEMSSEVGFGSSAATTVAMHAALFSWLSFDVSVKYFIEQAVKIVRHVQGIGSGADVAASVCGGMVRYRNQPFEFEKFRVVHPLVVFYSGYKTPTVQVIKQVEQQFAGRELAFKEIIKQIEQCSAMGIAFVKEGAWQALGAMMNEQQTYMQALGVNTPLLQSMVDILQKTPGILGAKISGSGLGDCVVGLAMQDECLIPAVPGAQQTVAMTLRGVERHAM